MKPNKRKARADAEDDIAAEAQQRAQPAVAQVPSSPATVLVPSAAASSSLSLTEEMQWSAPAPVTAINEGGEDAASSASAVVFPSATFASPQLTTAAAASGAASPSIAAVPVAADGQAHPLPATPFGQLADVEVQLIMLHLDQQSPLHLARCGRSLLRCASHPFVWQRLHFRVNVRGSEVSEDPRRTGSLLRFAPSNASVGVHDLESIEAPVTCATLIRVPRIATVFFHLTLHPLQLMQTDEWNLFLQHPSAQKLERVLAFAERNLCDATSVALLSQLPLLHKIGFQLPTAAPPPSYLAPLVNCPVLTNLELCGSRGNMNALPLPTPLDPLGRCSHLRMLCLKRLFLRIGQLSEVLTQLAQAGSQLEVLHLVDLRMLPMDHPVLADQSADDAANIQLLFSMGYLSHVCEPHCDALSFEIILAAPSLSHVHELKLFGSTIGLDCVPYFPSLRLLCLVEEVLPSAMKLELLLRRLPHLHCTLYTSRTENHRGYELQKQNTAMLPRLTLLALQHPRLSIHE